MRAGRLRSRIAIHRPSESRGALNAVITTHPEIGKAWAGFQPPKRMLESYGAGEQPEGRMEAELRAGVDLQARDVIVVHGGPERGTRWTVLSTHEPGYGRALVLLEVHTGEFTVTEPSP